MASVSERERAAGRIEFVAAHQPTFPSGVYGIAVEQRVAIGGADTATFRSKTQTIVVESPRYALNPRQIAGVFPPAGSLGDHASALPHVLLTPSTLPWERSGAAPADPDIPWLALLLFGADELSQLQVQPTTAGKLQEAGLFALTEGQHADDPVTILQAPVSLIAPLLPRRGELRWLTHVRRTTDAAGHQQGVDTAVVIGNRLPLPGGVSVAHLVSVEGRYADEEFAPAAQGAQIVTFVSLASWRFACVDARHSVPGLLTHIPQQTLRWPDTGHADADSYVGHGYVPLPHAMRAGNRSVSWYRGPLVPGRVTVDPAPALPARSGDALVRYSPALSMFDVSYAAAWELGRLMMLNASAVALDLYRWKRRHAQHGHEAARRINHLPFDSAAPDTALPDSVEAWVERVALLRGIPFQYLIPDERLLPQPSIRFFQVDGAWLACLVDGALSIGSVAAGDHRRARALRAEQPQPYRRQISGLLLRSEVVSEWEHLRVNGFARGYGGDGVSGETQLLFALPDPAPLIQPGGASLEELHEQFDALSVALSDSVAIDERAWEIADAVRYEIVEGDGGRLDVRQSGQTQRRQIAGDADIRAALRRRVVSAQLRQALRQLQIELTADATIAPLRWFMADSDEEAYYLIEREGAAANVYRDYRLPLLRMEPLSHHVLLCLFEGIVQTVDIYQRPESIHHGLESDEEVVGFFKHLRNDAGVVQDASRVQVAFRQESSRVIDVVQLASALHASDGAPGAVPFTAAQFALQMIEDVPRVRYVLSDETAGNLTT